LPDGVDARAHESHVYGRVVNILGRSETRRIPGVNALPQSIRENIWLWIDFNIDVLANYEHTKICA
jgi:hypothetical protein